MEVNEDRLNSFMGKMRRWSMSEATRPRTFAVRAAIIDGSFRGQRCGFDLLMKNDA